MQQLMEFAANHAILVGGFVAVLGLLAWTEFAQLGRGFRMLSPAEAVAFMNSGDARVIDVSPSNEFAKGHIAGARNIPLSRLQASDKEVSKLLQRPLLVTCRAGNTAQMAASKLAKLGAGEVAVLRGGNSQWMSDNYPVSRN